MATCGRLDHIFEKPLPENPTLLESLSSWKQIKSMKPIDDSSFTEIFGELHFKEKSHAGKDDPHRDKHENKILTSSYCYPFNQTKQYYKNSDSLSLCTEGLGFESSGDVDYLLSNDHTCRNDHKQHEDRKVNTRNIRFSKNDRFNRGEFPPPISCIGSSGQPGVCFKSYRQDGRFILKEIRIPTQEVLHACRENGRLRLQLIQSDDEILDEDDEEKYADEEQENAETCHGSS
ncbi:protein FANTASTIC FOUR 3-like [Primulina tabacum]|uniref:protein FANTASTIC FOUR 3-like n=1 Tax=Primulina tabacum TaxID=48773 RepID=UPI003F5A3FC9